jgi:hypothetical protein
MNKKGDEIIYDKPINVCYSTLTKENKINIINIFEKHLFGQYSWNGSNNITMSVYFYKNENIKKTNKKTIKDNDYYPQLNIYIDTNIKLFDNPLILDELITYLQKTCEPSYDVLWEYDDNNIHFTIFLLDNKKIIEKLKKYITKQTYISKTRMSLHKSENSKEENI